MKLYTIANETHETYGHGDFGVELRICKQGSYGSGLFPPLFRSADAAQKWMEESSGYGNQRVVQMELIEDDPSQT